MDTGRVNKSPLSLREGKVFIDGYEVADSCKAKITFVPKVWEGKSLGDPATNRRWLAYDIKVTIEQWKTTPLYKNKVLAYIQTGATPEFTVQGISDDKNSDYYANNGGGDTVTAVGCVLTGEIDLLELDTDGDVVKESIEMGAHHIV